MEAFLFQAVQTPTQGNGGLVSVFTCEIGEPLANTDHNIVRINLYFQIKTRENELLVPNCRKTNFANIKREVESINWSMLFHVTCIDEL